jgi:hypothetical protein
MKRSSDPVMSLRDERDDRVTGAIQLPAVYAKEAIAKAWLPFVFLTLILINLGRKEVAEP